MSYRRKSKLALGIVIGVLGAVAVFCIAVGIGCAVNGLTFGEQIVEWFGSSSVVEETAEQVIETITETPVA